MIEIEKGCKRYADVRRELSALVDEVEGEVAAIRRRHMARIRHLVSKAADEHNGLVNLVESQPSLFQGPKTVVLHGIRVGYRKAKGSIEWADEDQVIKLVRRHLPDQADVLIRTTEKVNKAAVSALPVADARRIGCTVLEAGDAVVVKPMDEAVDKIVNALLASAIEDEVREVA